MNAGDTAFILMSSALVAIMTPGLAFFYGGLVGRKNVLTIMMQSFIAMGVVSVIWLLFGFSLAFSGDIGGVIGNFDFALLNHVGMEPHSEIATTIPFFAFFVFQMMFAVITPALITGAFTERIKFGAYLVFMILWSILVYVPLAHWVWGGGFIATIGALDFAGGTVVHISAGFAALASILVLGRRIKKDSPHNISKVALGTALLWFGWYGFNAGSALSANGQAAIAFVNTQVAASVAMVTWLLISWLKDGRPSMVGALTGVLAGLVAITPAAGFVEPWAALVIGVAASIVSFYSVEFRIKRKWDDALDVWAVHGMSGVTGSILTGVFAAEAIGGASGWIEGNFAQFMSNVYGTAIAIIFSFVATWIILKVVTMVMDYEVTDAEIQEGLDRALHGEDAYDF